MLELPLVIAAVGGGGWVYFWWPAGGARGPRGAGERAGVELSRDTGPGALRRQLFGCGTLLCALGEAGEPARQLRCLRTAVRALAHGGCESADEVLARLETCLRRLGIEEREALGRRLARLQVYLLTSPDRAAERHGADMWCCVAVISMVHHIESGAAAGGSPGH